MDTKALFYPLRIGSLDLKHRVVMAPITRMRAKTPANAAHSLNAEYYRQRASEGGLIIAEGSQVTPAGQGYPATPGIYSDEQIEGWKRVTTAVHAQGGLIFLQLWHVGRISHSSFQPDGVQPVAPSAVAAKGDHFTATWAQAPFQTPRALEISEIHGLIEAYRDGARYALDAGFDGVELHGANGYLIEQFLQSRTNRRDDIYGGSIPNRTRLLQQVVSALIDTMGSAKVGVRLSPFGTTNDSGEEDPLPLYQYAIAALAELGPAYLHLIEPRIEGRPGDDVQRWRDRELLRKTWPGVLISADRYDPKTAEKAVAAGFADAVAFGRSFIANPDLVERIRIGAPLNPWDRSTFYGGGEAGYTDYPRLHPDLQIEPA
ncbi:alkene reductase [Rhizobium sp. 1399]|uniref:alkene reductase n=1 Tax=Rhizobium sp. 1399 TaxID=2817758 RepID=UPI0028652DE5|nr:alkene reductase [Rhizobium sp. 1399]MDR6670987.1 N-ethylmaleimide reductase [Rhizobium sp. 1399]